MNAERPAVTVLGLGSMGSALAAALLDRGHPTTVWNRSAGKARPLVERGARLAPTAWAAVEASPLVVACVLDYPALHSVLGPVAGALSGRSLVNLTTGSPEQANAALDWARANGIDYLDGAIMTTPPEVGDAEMMFLYSGSRTAFDAHRPTLEALGDPLYLGADPGLASLYDVALLGVMWSTMAGWLHAAALVGADRTPAVDFTQLAVRWLSGAVSGFLTRYAAQVDAGRYPGDDATVDVQIAAIDHLIHAAEARGIDNGLPELLKGLMERAAAAGHGADSFAGVVEVLRQPVEAR
ncbi:NAD(P)-binding domain-containing protein [Streptomonospora sp. S1-112]|uniref:NAD(P)-binding domain-containing protein n=1 Tax=Streptomonospora mangrovi TaxID=2883123 RepID=A0A9X3SF16_9ACTN|nr:NAD(P)-binding domain-containing protein [Streptomonospora mangrovi]MDA0565512.1 NAD(P)-binding domain-containing protein [Streptomonospora mangrovi]